MAAPDDRLYEYAIIRYVPRIDRGEFLNVGLIMLCKRRRWMRGEIWIDAGRLLAFDPKADIESLRRQLAIFERDDVPVRGLPAEERYRWLTAAKSAIIQTSPSHPGLLSSDDQDKEFSRLLGELVK